MKNGTDTMQNDLAVYYNVKYILTLSFNPTTEYLPERKEVMFIQMYYSSIDNLPQPGINLAVLHWMSE